MWHNLALISSRLQTVNRHQDQHPDNTNPQQRPQWQAILFALIAVSIWAWWMSATRIAATDGIAPIDVALLRYSVPALLLLSVWRSTLRKMRTAPRWALFAMLGWGAPFLWLVTASLQSSNVIYMATIVPCTMPLFAVLAERVFFKTSLTTRQLLGFSLIAVAALLMLLSAIGGYGQVTIDGIMLMLCAAAGWACYVVAFRHTGLTAAEGAAWVCVASTAVILLIKLFTGSPLLTMSMQQITFNAFAQGVVSGFLAVILYTLAIERLGAARAASFSVLMPALGALFAWLWLGETPTAYNLFALTLGSIGVAVVNGLIKLPRSMQSTRSA